MILVCRRERKAERARKKKRFPQPDSSAVSITSHYLPSGGGWGGEEAVVGFWLYHNKNSPDPP